MRTEDQRLLTGQGRYVDDLPLPGALHGAVLRSPLAHARITHLDVMKAAGLPGVARVVTAADLGSERRLPVIRTHPGLVHPVGPQVLAGDVVRHAGEPVAFVLAENRYLAEDALEAIVADYEPLQVVADATAALQVGAARVHSSLPSNLAGSFTQRTGEAAAGLAAAPHRFSFRCSIDRGSAQPLETRGVAAAADGDVLRVWMNTQRPHGIRDLIADYLGVPDGGLQVLVPDTGGSFGSKAYLYPEDLLVAWAATVVDRPVRWTEDRAESFLATFPEHRQVFDVEVGTDEQGRLLALRVELLHDLGAYSPYGFAILQNTADHVVGPYRIPAVEFTGRAVYTNRTPSAAYRGAGRPQGVFVIERAMDVIARQLELDPAEVRRRNLVRPTMMPYDTGLRTPAGPLIYDSGDYPRCFELALRSADYDGWRRRKDDGRMVGVGVANYIECSITQPHESARITLSGAGRFRVAVGVSAQGQGHETVFADVAARVLAVPASIVTVVGAASELTETVGTYASRSAIMAGNAVAGAARLLRDRLLAFASVLLEVTPAAVAITTDGIAHADGGTGSLTWQEIGRAAAHQGLELEAEYVFRSGAWHVANGTHVVVLEVAPNTGQVTILRYVVAHDAGRMLHRGIVEGQILGGIAQGIAGSLLEELVYDDQGQLLSGSLMDYLLPTTVEIPDVEIHHLETPSPNNPLGVKGAGEGGILPSYAAVISALEDAVGESLFRLPMTPASLRQVLRRRVVSLTLERVGLP
jgi:aerobic carbon-monoxide dehydrogenase large subunit